MWALVGGLGAPWAASGPATTIPPARVHTSGRRSAQRGCALRRWRRACTFALRSPPAARARWLGRMAGADPPPADCAARARGVPSPSARTPRGASGVRDMAHLTAAE
eukprot:7389711-Prymnesium_polylepis.1